MTREESKMMQGVAILIMIFFHLFNPSLVEGYEGTITGNAARAANPVSFYVILSGYGLYMTKLSGGGRNSIKRCLRLYINYWIITGSLLFLSYLLNYGNWQFDTFTVMNNISGWKTTYYTAAWFVLPYCILAITKDSLFRILDCLGNVKTLLVFFSVYLFSSWMNHNYVFFRMNIFQTLYLLFPFILGAAMVKSSIVWKAKDYLQKQNSFVPIALIAVLMVVRYFAYTGVLTSIFAAVFILLFTCVKKPGWMKRILLKLGNASFNMWMCHIWICWYFLRDVIYGLENPLLIFLATTFLSYAIAIFFHHLTKPIIKKI